MDQGRTLIFFLEPENYRGTTGIALLATGVSAMRLVKQPVDAASEDAIFVPQRNERDVDALYRSEKPGLVRFFQRRISSQHEAEDLAQETLARFLRAFPSADIQSPQAYLQTIAVNLLRDRADRGSKRLADISVSLDEGRDSPAPFDQHRELVGREELAHFDVVLRQLKPRTLEIFLLSRVEGYTYTEIARSLGMTLFGVKWHMLKAIAHVDQHRKDR